uniref:INO80 complex subunit E N-terminal domain-containing protein n=1 Tax=Anopheles farauti TaxID=69004 RepID=A0A182Q5H7_9DIPT
MAKEESKYGFKDKAKAEESLELLKAEDQKYQLLTVRGLIGRAKRVLTLTKAEDKINNIKAAIEIFEKWLEVNSSSTTKNAKPKDSEDKVETVPGLGFKDKQAAEQTLSILEGRDPDYQKLAIKGLIGSAKRVIPATKNEDKLKSIKEAVAVFEDFLDEFDRQERGKQNMPYLPIDLIRQLPTPDQADKLAVEFIDCYETVAKGNYKHLRTKVPKDGSKTWDIVRNSKLQTLKQNGDVKLFDPDGLWFYVCHFYAMLGGWYCRTMNEEAQQQSSQMDSTTANIDMGDPPMDNYSSGAEDDSEDEESVTLAADYKALYTDLKKKVKILIYENVYFQNNLRASQKRLLKITRDRSFLLDRLLEYERPELSSSDSDDTVDSDDSMREEAPSKRRKFEASSTQSTPSTMKPPATPRRTKKGTKKQPQQQQQESYSQMQQLPQQVPTELLATTACSDINLDVATDDGSMEGQLTKEELERHLQSRQTMPQVIPEGELPIEMFNNNPSNELADQLDDPAQNNLSSVSLSDLNLMNV